RRRLRNGGHGGAFAKVRFFPHPGLRGFLPGSPCRDRGFCKSFICTVVPAARSERRNPCARIVAMDSGFAAEPAPDPIWGGAPERRPLTRGEVQHCAAHGTRGKDSRRLTSGMAACRAPWARA